MKISNPPIGPSACSCDIAILGMACRFPGGVNSPEAFWNFLMAGGDGIAPVPPDRWETKAYFDRDRDKKNRMFVDRGGFVGGLDQFDPLFFGISPAEAGVIDPQHRWLLELTYEVLENAGLNARDLRGSDTAVYMGQFMHDYEQLQLDAMAHGLINSHSATGASMTLTANRISYCFDLRGPSVTLDTACSSSLVAVDFACKALLGGDCQLALAGGVNLLLRPELTLAICKASMLSPDGRCKSFDAAANGYVRSEGAGIVVLKRLADAERDGDPILAVIKASGVNQDGHTAGITVPSGDAQKLLLRRSLERAGFSGAEIQYVEAHGTGTPVGDPIEANALGHVLGVERSDAEPCVIGSVKSNIGHMESAAGMAGLIKTVLAMNQGTIPANLHFHEVNPAIDLAALKLRVATSPLPWPDTQGGTRKAIVNSFGFGGTNANVVLEAPSRSANNATTQAHGVDERTRVLVLSSKTEPGLKQTARKYAAFLETAASDTENDHDRGRAELRDICYTAAVRREHHKHRLAVIGSSAAALQRELDDFSEGRPGSGYVSARALEQALERPCFVYSGMGTQWPGMGRELYGTEPVFRAAFARCSQALEAYSGWSLVGRVFAVGHDDGIDDTSIAQPAIFAVQVALTELLKSWGIQPSAVVGHSAGEVSAAYIAGALSFEDAIRVVHHRSRLQATTEGLGKMLAVGLNETALMPYLTGVEAQVSIAAINSADALTLSGDEEALREIAARLEADGVFARALDVGVPYHSPVMDRLQTPLIQALAGISVNAPHTPLYSTVSGALTRSGDWSAEYWSRNVREPVLFKSAIDRAVADGSRIFLEVGPHAALAPSIAKNLERNQVDGTVVTTLKRGQHDSVMLARTLATLHVHGYEVDFRRLYPDGGRLIALPNYAWQQAKYWHEAEEVKRARLRNVTRRDGFADLAHPLLGSRLNSTTPIWQNALDLQEQAYLADHQVEGDAVYPGSAYVEMALAISSQRSGRSELTLQNVEFKRALFLDREKPTWLESTLLGDETSLVISALDAQSGRWSLHSQAILLDAPPPAPPERLDLTALWSRCPSTLEKEEFYAHCRSLGLSYQRLFQAVQRAWFGENELLTEILMPEQLSSGEDAYLLHPVLLDAAIQGLLPTVTSSYLPVKIAELHYHRRPNSLSYCHVTLTERAAGEARGDLVLADADGTISVEVRGIELRATRTANATASSTASLLYDFHWEEQAAADFDDGDRAVSQGSWLILSDGKGVGARIVEELRRRGQSVLVFDALGSSGHDHVDAKQNVARVFEQAAASCRAVLYLCALDAPACENLSPREVLDSCRLTTLVPLLVVQALDGVAWRSPPRFYFVTQGAHQVAPSDPAPEPAQGALWGFGRVFTSEFPAYAGGLVDLPSEPDDSVVSDFVQHLLGDEFEQEIALRPGARYFNRLRVLGEEELQRNAERRREPARDRPFRIVSTTKQSGERGWSASSFVLSESAPDDVSLKVERAALTKSDLERVLETSRTVTANYESACVGVVLDAGSASPAFAAGSEVIGFAAPGLASFGYARAAALAHKPRHLSLDHAVLLPAVYLKVHYALTRVANLRPGESVLVHEGADVLGLAAIQLARAAGATVLASARTPAKRGRLNALGVAAHDPTSSTFIDEILAATAGRGVDVALNLLDKQFLSKTMAVLKPMGRFVELGRACIPANPALLEQLVEKNLSYGSVDLQLLSKEDPALSGRMLAELSQMFEDQSLEPLDIQSFPSSEIGSAVSYLGNAEEGGVVSLDFDSPEQLIHRGFEPNWVTPHKSYLISGGLGALGLEVGRWLAAAGARSIVLMGRSEPSETARAAIDSMRAEGVAVTILQGDVAEPADVSRALNTIAERLLPLGGIVHAAGVLDDGVIAHQTEERFERVLAPKVRGAWNLHLQTEHSKLDFFVLFSSIAAVVGWAGQGNYAAGNAFMDTLAQYRRALGKPALSVNWGPWSGAGMAGSLEATDLRRMKEAGLTALDAPAALSAMGRLLSWHVTQAGVFDVDWSTFVKHTPDAARRTVFRNLTGGFSANLGADLSGTLAAASESEKLSLLAAEVSSQLAVVLGLTSSTGVDRNGNVFDYGMNSLMAMDLINRLQAALKIKLPATLVLKHPTIDGMARYIAEQLSSEHPARAGEDLYWDPKAPEPLANREINGRLQTLTSSVLHWIHEGHSAHFNVGSLLEIDSDKFDLKALKTALDILFTYHDGCRLQIFSGDAGMQAELVPLGSGVRIVEHDLRGLGYEAGAARMTALNDELHASLRFTRGDPLYRAAYYQLDAATPHRFFLIFHHYVADGWSLKLLSQQFPSIYLKVLAGEPVWLPTKSFTLLDWTRRLHEFAHADAERQIPYWVATLDRARRAEITDELCSHGQRCLEDYSVHTRALDPDELLRLSAYCREHNLELSDVGTYALVKAFSKLTGVESLWAELTIHARSGVFADLGIFDLFGQISEAGAVLFELPQGRSEREQIAAIRQQRLDAPNAGIGLRALRFVNQRASVREAIKEESAPQVGLNFDLTDYANDARENSWFRFAREGIGNAQADHLRKRADELRLTFYVRVYRHEGGLVLTIAYYRDRFRDETIAALGETFFSVMSKLADSEGPARPRAVAQMHRSSPTSAANRSVELSASPVSAE